jgi:hypothetical protein
MILQVLALIVTAVGCNSIVNAELYDFWTDTYAQICKAIPNCPDGWRGKERAFMGISIFCLILSAGNLVLSFFVDLSCSGKRLAVSSHL